MSQKRLYHILSNESIPNSTHEHRFTSPFSLSVQSQCFTSSTKWYPFGILSIINSALDSCYLQPPLPAMLKIEGRPTIIKQYHGPLSTESIISRC